jgi:hypothetical protein
MSAESFTIDKVSWHTQREGNLETRAQTIARIWSVVAFLQDNGLTEKVLASSEHDITDEFSIEAADLTERGLEVMRKAYDKWVGKIDKGMDPKDTSLLVKALKSK